MLPFLIVEHQFMKNSNRGLQYKIAMGYTSRALLYKMSVKLKKTEQRHCPPARRATSPVSLVIFLWCIESCSLQDLLLLEIKCPATSQFRAPSVALTKRRSLKTLPTFLLITVQLTVHFKIRVISITVIRKHLIDHI